MTDRIRRRLFEYKYGDLWDKIFLRVLSPLEPVKGHRRIVSTRFEGVGNWILETVEFREWRSSEGGVDKAVLFCSGNPGVGKTYIK